MNYKGNRIDIGGHRFFSKSERIMKWWTRILPIQASPPTGTFTLRYQGADLPLRGGGGPNPDETDLLMLVRSRLSRIYHGGKFFNYPITLDAQTMRNLGFIKLAHMGLSYVAAKVRPLQEENLEDFYVNRFGRVLYNTFFRDYTEKVWGVPCKELAADWGAQRVKGLSIRGAVSHALKKQFGRERTDLSQHGVETSLIEYFLYPKFGPGQLWERVAQMVEGSGGEVHVSHVVTGIHAKDGGVIAVEVRNVESGQVSRVEGDYFFSTMPVADLISALHGIDVPPDVVDIAAGLPYRDFVTVGVLARKLMAPSSKKGETEGIPDNWIYIQDPRVRVGRLQVFNNWSPYMVADSENTWVGMEYFCDEGDVIWSKPDEELGAFAVAELAEIGLVDPAQVLDTTVIRMKKTYPAYFGTYADFDRIRDFTDGLENLFLIGRNGQHRYNNQDHSMLTAMEAVSNVLSGRTDKANVWNVNVERDYHEER